MSIVYGLSYLLSFLPLWLLYLISDLCYIIIYYLIGYRKKVVVQNLTHAFANKTAQQRKSIEKAFYQHLCDLLFEHIKALTITPKRLVQQVTINGNDIETLERFYQKGQSIILVAGHFGNWEWIAHALAYQTSYTICAGYQPLHHTNIDQTVRHIRSRFQRKAIPITALLRHIRSYTGAPQATTLLIDQAPLHKGSGHATTFLAQPTSVALTAAKLAQKCNQPIFYIQIERIKRGKYQAKPILLAERPDLLPTCEIAEQYTRKLEADILRNPPFWLWSHRRWKA
ncbi:lysophospholipid acyltransferase family protein [Cardinium endosymbiont of Nabis limbatus]|uniref:lysophospholipid acyltransferase family protein n=1 Tax=Cardinium endosymbiont of Nabis limbatus TaxID=3066217 RepID=UPI003AF37AF7